MDLNFKIIWFEDVDEWFDTHSRRLSRYIAKKNLNAKIERVRGTKDFCVEEYKIEDYDLLIVDYELEKVYKEGVETPHYGYQIIEKIRAKHFFNDILFYSSHGSSIINGVMREMGLQGVFVADRDSSEFREVAEALIDKAVRRAENPVNIRGIFMDSTSDFDNIIKEIISGLWRHLGKQEEAISNKIQKEILQGSIKSAEGLCKKYAEVTIENIDNLLNETDFSAYRQARLLYWCINADDKLKEVFRSVFNKYTEKTATEEKIPFFQKYNEEIISMRNILAHVKCEAVGEEMVCVGEIEGKSVTFDATLCNDIRKKLIVYGNLLSEMNKLVKEMN